MFFNQLSMQSRIRFKPIKLIGITILLAVSSFQGEAQFLNPPKIESPNAASLGVYGDYPVSTFTGSPTIQIPIHTVQSGRIQLPVSLRYSAASVRPSQEPGWVGTGWDLESIGTITRTIRGVQDEFYITNATGIPTANNTSYYYPFPGQTVSTGAEYANLPNWNSPSQLAFDFTSHANVNANPQIMAIDVQADEFSFNFLGYSGKFYWSGPQKGWQVVSDSKIKVLLNSAPGDFMDPLEIINEIRKFQIPNINNLANISDYQSRMFKSFTIITPDGTKYIFGGTDAVEFYSNRHQIVNSSAPEPVFIASTWLLKKIIDVNNNEIQLNYKRNLPAVKLNLNFFEFSSSCQQNTPLLPFFLPRAGTQAFNSNYVDANYHSSILQWPMYLTEIISPSETVKFSSTIAACKRYSNDQLRCTDIWDIPNTPIDNSILGLDYPANLDRMQWEKLDNIVISENYRRATIKKFTFGYNPSSSQRLTLTSLKETGMISGGLSKDYYFEYNSIETLPLYDGNYTDHWGYYNGTDINFARASDLNSRKSPTTTSASGIGLLTKIKFPTGGHTNFVWEINDVSAVVSVGRNSLVSTSGNRTVGGYRIKEILNYSFGTELATSKKYYYRKGYTAGANVNLLVSSGVLNGEPAYSFLLQNRLNVLGNATTVSLGVNYFTGIQNFSYSGQGSHVGYEEVAEVNNDGSYTIHKFTSYGTDINGVSHFDRMPAGFLGWLPGVDTYFPMSSLEKERGNPVSTELYSASNILLQKTKITYRNDPERFDNYIKIIDNHGSYGSIDCGDALVLTTARYVYNYVYYPVSKTVIQYDQFGNNPLTEIVEFTYNENNLIRTEKKTDSKGVQFTTTYKYPSDFAEFPAQASILQSMHNAGMLTTVVDTKVISGTSTPVSQAHTNYFSPLAGIYLPLSIEAKTGSAALETKALFNKYDKYGNILELQKPGDVLNSYIRDYSGKYIIASVTGANLLSVAYTSFEVSEYSAYSPGNQLGGWTVPLNWSSGPSGYLPTNLDNTFFVTGRTSYNLINGNISFSNSLNSSEKYVVTYWSKGGQYSVSGTLSVVTGRIVNGWTYYEHTVSGVASVSISGNGLIDELRLFPQLSQMTTYCYKPSTGITEQCDANSRITYYEYDVFHRLVLVRDQDQKILRKLCYNYSGQAEDCNFFGNQERSASFTRNNCGTDYEGGVVSYVVPAGRYFSAVSQQEANDLAQADVNASGQAYANSNGVCKPFMKYSNTTSIPYTITLTSVATGAVTSFSAYPSSTVQQLGAVTPGNYNITVAPMYSSSTTVQLIFNGTTQTAVSFTFSNVALSTPATFVLSTAPASGPCSFTASPGFSIPTSSISSNGSTASFYIVFYSTSVMSQGNSYLVATVNGSCRPSVVRYISTTIGGRNWTITIHPDGRMYWQMAYGSSSISPYSSVGSSTLTYSL